MNDQGKDEAYPSGRPPWDRWNAVRIGALTGGILGVMLSWILRADNFWLVLPGAAIGAGIGYWTERQKTTKR